MSSKCEGKLYTFRYVSVFIKVHLKAKDIRSEGKVNQNKFQYVQCLPTQSFNSPFQTPHQILRTHASIVQ